MGHDDVRHFDPQKVGSQRVPVPRLTLDQARWVIRGVGISLEFLHV